MIFHAGCLPKYRKEEDEKAKKTSDAVNYEKPADVQPAYYRTGDRDANAPAKMESGKEYKAQ